MKKINFLVTCYSAIAIVVIIERLSPTTKVLLQPNNFIRLHEINQTVIFLPATVILSFFILGTLTDNFRTLSKRKNSLLLLLFLSGVYLYGAGEGWHEIASFTLNEYCNILHLNGNLCKGLFINDYYAGNIIFFVGGIMMNFSLLTYQSLQKIKKFSNKDMVILLANSIVYAFTWFAYAAFDRVLVGFFFSTLFMLISFIFVLKINFKYRSYPYITYSALAYTLATIATLIIKFH